MHSRKTFLSWPAPGRRSLIAWAPARPGSSAAWKRFGRRGLSGEYLLSLSHHLGLHAATLVALHVPDERIDEIAAVISSYPEVSHNFRRDHYYSLWFTLAAKDREGIRKVLDEILDRTGIPASDALDLPTVQKMKIDVRFSFSQAGSSGGADGSD